MDINFDLFGSESEATRRGFTELLQGLNPPTLQLATRSPQPTRAPPNTPTAPKKRWQQNFYTKPWEKNKQEAILRRALSNCHRHYCSCGKWWEHKPKKVKTCRITPEEGEVIRGRDLQCEEVLEVSDEEMAAMFEVEEALDAVGKPEPTPDEVILLE